MFIRLTLVTALVAFFACAFYFNDTMSAMDNSDLRSKLVKQDILSPLSMNIPAAVLNDETHPDTRPLVPLDVSKPETIQTPPDNNIASV